MCVDDRQRFMEYVAIDGVDGEVTHRRQTGAGIVSDVPTYAYKVLSNFLIQVGHFGIRFVGCIGVFGEVFVRVVVGVLQKNRQVRVERGVRVSELGPLMTCPLVMAMVH